MNSDADKSGPSLPPAALKLSRESAPPSAASTAAAESNLRADGSTTSPPPAPRRKKTSLTMRDWAVRGLIVGILLLALGVLLWSYRRLVPVQREGRVLAARVDTLQADIVAMEKGVTPADLEQLARELQFTGQLLLNGEQALVSWLNDLRRTAVPLALEATANFGQPRPPAATNVNVAVVPTQLTVNLKPSEDVSSPLPPPSRVLRLLHELLHRSNRADLVALHITAGSNSIAQVRADLELWAGGEEQP